MENLETNEVTTLMDKPEKKLKGKSNFEIKPKLVAILLIVNLAVGIFNLVGIGYLSFKDNNRNQMMRTNFPNGGNFNPPNGDMFNQQQQDQGQSSIN